MIQAIIFDVGGVLIRTGDHQPRREWEQKLGLRPWESEEIVFSSDAGTAAQMGELSDGQLWEWIGRRLQLSDGARHRFQRDFWSGDELDHELVDLIRRLHGTYQTAIISNATDSLRHLLTEKHQIADAFDVIVCSAEEGIMKPHSEIYRRTLARLQREPQEAVFIDDAPANISGARDMGLQTIYYREGLDVEQALRRLGIEVPQTPSRTRDESETQQPGGQSHA